MSATLDGQRSLKNESIFRCVDSNREHRCVGFQNYRALDDERVTRSRTGDLYTGTGTEVHDDGFGCLHLIVNQDGSLGIRLGNVAVHLKGTR